MQTKDEILRRMMEKGFTMEDFEVLGVEVPTVQEPPEQEPPINDEGATMSETTGFYAPPTIDDILTGGKKYFRYDDIFVIFGRALDDPATMAEMRPNLNEDMEGDDIMNKTRIFDAAYKFVKNDVDAWRTQYPHSNYDLLKRLQTAIRKRAETNSAGVVIGESSQQKRLALGQVAKVKQLTDKQKIRKAKQQKVEKMRSGQDD